MVLGAGEGALIAARYRLERVLGTGGMASVWLARDERLGRLVAVKLISDSLVHDESYLRRFHREARLAAGLSHPNLVKVYDFAGEGGRPYLVMEYVEGESLAGRIADGTVGELDPGRLLGELLGALDHIHAAGIVHRDIKPGNVLIAPDNGAKVTDFGIARPEDATRLTSTGLVVGTRDYIAPEVLRGEPATVRSDLYSCAIVLQEAFGNRLPPALAPLVSRLGAEDPARRPESASRALARLAASSALSDSGVSDTTPTAPLPGDRTTPTAPIGAAARAHPGLRLLGGLALLLAALLVVGILLLSGDASSPGGGQSNSVKGQEGSPQDQPRAAEAEGAASSDKAQPPKPAASPGKSEKVKPPGPPKSPPGKAIGLRKHSKSSPGKAKGHHKHSKSPPGKAKGHHKH